MPARVLAACFALVGFSGAAVVGLLAGNDPFTTLIRAMVVMFVCWLVGRICGAISMVSVREYLHEHQARYPMPGDVNVKTTTQPDDDQELDAEPA